jgi:hypothetical protein
MKISEFCTELDAQLGRLDPDERLGLAVKMLGKVFKVSEDEVAIFTFDPRFEVLRFIWPAHLRSTGIIPLASKSSLVARTMKNRRGYLDNLFHKSAHTFIFEAVSAPRAQSAKPQPIQKILSTPMMVDEVITGVIQVSRKGASPQEAGPDFSPSELDALTQVAAVVGKHL